MPRIEDVIQKKTPARSPSKGRVLKKASWNLDQGSLKKPKSIQSTRRPGRSESPTAQPRRLKVKKPQRKAPTAPKIPFENRPAAIRALLYGLTGAVYLASKVCPNVTSVFDVKAA